MSRDVYAPATAGLVDEAPTLERSVMWKIYFVIIILITLVGFATQYSMLNAGIAEIVSALLAVPAMVGLFGYAFSKKILNGKIWLVVLVVYLVWSGLYPFVTNLDLTAGGMLTDTMFWISQAVGWVIAFPSFLALYLYGRSSYPLWETP
ncbi:MAG: hypothetical protein O7G86_10715 [Gammaproteobacteria bacterium]|nr:hypothetical protein [Gammaproteobacteria bacterium]